MSNLKFYLDLNSRKMGAEQSALLACSQTGNQEIPLSLDNSELFFRLYFDKMPKPETGPITEALLHLIQNIEMRGPLIMAEDSTADIDSGFENDDIEMLSGELVTNDDQENFLEDWDNENEISIESISTNLSNDYDDNNELEPIIWNPLKPIDAYDTDDDVLNENDEDNDLPLPNFELFIEAEE